MSAFVFRYFNDHKTTFFTVTIYNNHAIYRLSYRGGTCSGDGITTVLSGISDDHLRTNVHITQKHNEAFVCRPQTDNVRKFR